MRLNQTIIYRPSSPSTPRFGASPRSRQSAAPRFWLISCLVAVCAMASAPPLFAVEVGQRAPDFSLRGLDGATRTLTSEIGNTVVLFFFGHNDMSVCSASAKKLQTDVYDRYRGEDLVIFGIDCWNGTTSEVESFRQRNGIEYPLLIGGFDVARDAYGLPYHSFLVVDGTGVVTYLSEGPQQAAFDFPALQSAIDRSLRNTSSTSDATWGAIKSLYSRKSFPRRTT